MVLKVGEITTPVGAIILVMRGGTLCALAFADYRDKLQEELRRRFGEFSLERTNKDGEIFDRVSAYLAGDLQAIDSIRVDSGGTEFQRQVWSALREVPPGTTIAYGELARRIGRPTPVRAVGLANAVNPIPIVVPCHRAVGSTGALCGYGGGIERKRWLLRHEGVKRVDVGWSQGRLF